MFKFLFFTALVCTASLFSASAAAELFTVSFIIAPKRGKVIACSKKCASLEALARLIGSIREVIGDKDITLHLTFKNLTLGKGASAVTFSDLTTLEAYLRKPMFEGNPYMLSLHPAGTITHAIEAQLRALFIEVKS